MSGSTVASSTGLHVSKLSRNVGSEHLVEIFGTYGVVVRAEIHIDKRNGLSRGTATVVFDTIKEAENARIYLDGGQIDGSVISVVDKISHNDLRNDIKQVVQPEKNKNGKKQLVQPQGVNGRVV